MNFSIVATGVQRLSVRLQLFDGVFAECYGRYTDDNENKESFAPSNAESSRRHRVGGEGLTARLTPRLTASAWEWSSPESLGGSTFAAEVERYGGGGFYVDLPRDQEKVHDARAGTFKMSVLSISIKRLPCWQVRQNLPRCSKPLLKRVD